MLFEAVYSLFFVVVEVFEQASAGVCLPVEVFAEGAVVPVASVSLQVVA